MPADRRAHPRFPLVLTVQQADAGAAIGTTENLSAGGLLVRTDRRFAPGERTTLLVSFPQLLEPVAVTVEAVRLCRDADGATTGVAVRVPPELLEDRAKLAAVARRVAAGGGPAEARCRILLAEDSALVAQMYSTALRRLADTDELHGLEVEVRQDGAAAWDRLVRSPPIDLLITDVFMPVLDGVALVTRLRAEPAFRHLPVVVITSAGERERAALAALGVTLILQKPVKYPDLADTVRFLLRARRGQVTAPPRAALVPPTGPNPKSLTDAPPGSNLDLTKTPAPSR